MRISAASGKGGIGKATAEASPVVMVRSKVILGCDVGAGGIREIQCRN